MGRFEEAYALNQKWEILIKNTPKRFNDTSSSAFNSLNPAINFYSHQELQLSGEVKWMVGEKAEARKDFQAADKRRLLEYGEGSERYVQGKL